MVTTLSPETSRPAPRRTLSRAAILYLGGAVAATGAAVVATLETATQSEWALLAILAIAASVSQLLVVKTPANQAYYTTAVFFAAGVLLLPPPLVALLVLIAHLPEWLLYRYPWYIQTFNISNYTLAAITAGIVARALPETPLLDSEYERFAAGGAVASIVFVVLNHALLAQMLKLARGKSYRESNLFTPASLCTELVLAALGVGVAAAADVALALVPFVLAPLVLIHRALRLPSLEAAVKLDPKTGLYNARYFEAVLSDELDRAKRFARPMSVLVADLDFLREVNNNFGHLAGDAVLKGVADILRSDLRTFDIAARFGGEEYAVILPETSYEEALTIAEHVRATVETTPFLLPKGAGSIRATLSIGVAAFPEVDSADELVHQADIAMYRSKALGRNRVSGHLHVREPLVVTAVAGAARPDRRELREVVPPLAEPVEQPEAEGSRTPTLRFVAAVFLAGMALVAYAAPAALAVALDRPLVFTSFLLLTLGLQLLSFGGYGRGTEAVSVVGMLASGFVLGPHAAIAIAAAAAVLHTARRRGPVYRSAFDLGNFPLSAGAAVFTYTGLTASPECPMFVCAIAAFVAGLTYKAVNVGLLCLGMALDEGSSPRAIWNDRFRWAWIHYLAFGPLAFAAALAHEQMGMYGILTFAVPPLMLALSMRQYVRHTRAAADHVRRVNSELSVSKERARKMHLSAIAALSRSMEAKDNYSGEHIERVSAIAVALAKTLGYGGEELEAIEVGALMHDIGKIGIPERILAKPGPLTDEEWEVMRQHPVISDYILADIEMHPFVRQIVRWGHERIDGLGYPDQLAGDDVPMPARIVLVADTLDALTTNRPYRAACSVEQALEEVRRNTGTQFCPLVVAALEIVAREDPVLLGGQACATMPPGLRAVV